MGKRAGNAITSWDNYGRPRSGGETCARGEDERRPHGTGVMGEPICRVVRERPACRYQPNGGCCLDVRRSTEPVSTPQASGCQQLDVDTEGWCLFGCQNPTSGLARCFSPGGADRGGCSGHFGLSVVQLHTDST